MGKISLGLWSLLLVLLLAGCTGKSPSPDPDPSDFTRMTAQVLGNDGAPLSGLSVRVEGQTTGATTDASGTFTLDATAFPNGISASNEISLGRNGVVVGARDVVPDTDRNLTIRFGETDPGTGTGTGSVGGTVLNEITGAAISGVEITLFSMEHGVFQDSSDGSGAFSFAGVAAGNWQLVGFLNGYQPAMAFLNLAEGQTLEHSIALSPDGQIRPGEGIMVRGTLTNSSTGAPIGGALISMMADTGYIGIPEPGIWEDVANGSTNPVPGGAPDSPVSSDGREASTSFAPWRYDPQYQETTTAADGSFEFENEVVGYSLYFNYSADGYLAGSHYLNIDGVVSDVELALEMQAVVPTTVTGRIVDENGEPVEGWAEFIFAGLNGGGYPVDIAVPPVMDLDGWTDAGTTTRDNVGAPPPPMVPGQTDSDGAGLDDWAESAPEPATGGDNSAGGDPGAPGSVPGAGADNQFMQRFRFEQQQNRGTSDVFADVSSGYFAVNADAEGYFTLEGIPAGPYYVFSSAYRHESYSSDFTAEEDPSGNNITIVLPAIPVGSVEGTVTDENGLPVPDVLVNAVQPNVDPFTYTDASGNFRIDNVPAGTWTISGYKQGYLTMSQDTDIADDGVAHVDLVLHTYTPPPATLIPFTGRVFDGTQYDTNGLPAAGSGIVGADLVFTPLENEYGSYAQHVISGGNGSYGVSLINQFEYNLLIQAPGFQDLFTRIWVDSQWPNFDYSLWPVNAGPGGGGGGGVVGPFPGGVDPAEPGIEPQPIPGDDVPGDEPKPDDF